jgi:hypothetical protein
LWILVPVVVSVVSAAVSAAAMPVSRDTYGGTVELLRGPPRAATGRTTETTVKQPQTMQQKRFGLGFSRATGPQAENG